MILDSMAAYDITGKRTHVRRLTATRVRLAIARILKKTPLCAIATVGANRRAHVNTAYFAYSDALELWFLSHPASLHCRNLKVRPAIAIAVFESAQKWGELDRGVQLFGTCTEARGRAARRAEQAYGRRFKPFKQWKAGLTAEDAASEYRFYHFATRRLKLFDERQFGGAVFVSATAGRRQT